MFSRTEIFKKSESWIRFFYLSNKNRFKKNATGIDPSSLAKKVDLANLKSIYTN